MRATSVVLSIVLLTTIFGCKKGTVNGLDDSAIRYKYYNLEKNGWKSRCHTNLIEDINFTATEVPIQYYIVKDLGSEDLLKADSISNINKQERIIEFEFLHAEEKKLLDQTTNKLTYTQAVEYISFGIQADFYAVTSNKDTVKCNGVLYERTYNIAPYERVILFFSGISPNEKIKLVYNDRLFGKGIMKFNFNEKVTPLLL